jgi:flagellar motor protein MotB
MYDHDDDETPSGGYWPSVTDLFITLFIISIVMLVAVFYVLLPKNNIPALKQVQFAVGQDFNNVIEPINRLRVEIGMNPVRYRGASQAINDLVETSNATIQFLRELKKNDPDGMAAKIRYLEAQVKELNELVRELRAQIKNVPGSSVAELQKRIKELEELNQALLRENQDLKQESTTFVIDERKKEFRFDSGSPVIKRDFSEALRNNIEGGNAPFPDFAAKIIESPDRFNTLEIIGHTDGVPLSTTGNLDQRLPDILAGELGGSRTLSAGSNNDLGLLRALSLKIEWEEYVKSRLPVEEREVLRGIMVRCYSAGQTILPVSVNDPKPADFRKNDPRARRIEMRLTRLGEGVADEDTPKSEAQ